ncbi:hypothetical protein ACFQL1_13975 [Halomicroarcula sp. GCM10025709]
MELLVVFVMLMLMLVVPAVLLLGAYLIGKRRSSPADAADDPDR